MVGSSIFVESWWSMELAFSERRPRKLEEEQELGCGCRKARRQVFLHTHRTESECLCNPIICNSVPALNNPSIPKVNVPLKYHLLLFLLPCLVCLSACVNEAKKWMKWHLINKQGLLSGRHSFHRFNLLEAQILFGLGN